ncbi:MAG: DNA polymerase Y family protein [Planctomycetes bacterium]|nr:DNA polymerase Y family protein [Planctomycetota bacterium]
MKKRILCLWLPRWPIQRRIVAQPSLSGRPIVLHARDPRRGECVAVCSTAAVRQGVRAGMPLAEATSLMRNEGEVWDGIHSSDSAFRIPHSAFLFPHQPDADRQALLQLAAWCEQFSPQVGLETHPEPQSLLLDVTGLGPLFGGEEELAWRVIKAFGRRGYWVRVAVADTLGAAWAVSRYGPVGKKVVGTLRVPSAENGARSVPTTMNVSAPRIIPPGEHLRALAPLAVESLRLPAPTLKALHQLGVYQIGQVRELPRASLTSRFQHEGACVLLERLDQAFGAVEELITPHRPPPEFRAERCFEHPLDSLWEVGAVLAELFQSVCRELTARDQGALQALCRLDCEGGEVRKLDLGLFQPTAAAERLLELAALQLERTRLPGVVGRVGVEVPLATPLSVRQQSLFTETGRARPRELSLLIDRLSSRLGPQRVVRPRLLPDAQPERSYCEEELVGMRNAECGTRNRKSRKQNQSQNHSAFRTPHSTFSFPLRQWPSPIPIEVIAAADGPPAAFRVGRRRFRVHRWWGPQRIETAWWRGRSIRRDYYQIETTTGARYWLYRQLRNRRWFLHGDYG